MRISFFDQHKEENIKLIMEKDSCDREVAEIQDALGREELSFFEYMMLRSIRDSQTIKTQFRSFGNSNHTSVAGIDLHWGNDKVPQVCLPSAVLRALKIQTCYLNKLEEDYAN